MASDDPETIHVAEPPRRLLGNLLIDGHDGQCAYMYAGIAERCPNDAVAHTYMDHGDEDVRVEMCADHAREDVPEPPTTEQQTLETDGGTAITCPNCDAEGQGDAVLANDQRWCPTPQAGCPVVSFWEVDDAE